MLKRLLLILTLVYFGFNINLSFAEKWSERKSSHFVIYYQDAPQDFIENTIETAEEYYHDITRDLGFTRYGAWTWEDRCKIYIYKDADGYVRATKQPSWSSGAASYREKVINTYPLASGFFDTLLPHELGHIIFREFVGFRTDLPLWLDEGIASYQEKSRRWGANRIVKQAIKDKSFVPLEELSAHVLAASQDKKVVEIFYAEASSVIYYLITTFGKYRFVDLCKNLKAGKSFNAALHSAYSRFDSVKELEKAWLDYLKNAE